MRFSTARVNRARHEAQPGAPRRDGTGGVACAASLPPIVGIVPRTS
jgi:hypothetical protein